MVSSDQDENIIYNEKWPHLNKNSKKGEAFKGDQPKVPEIDYLTEMEKKQEANYLKKMAEDDSPWTSRTRFFLNKKENETGSSDLSLAKIPNLCSDTMILEIEKSDLLPVLDGWGFCLAGIFVGRFPGKEAVLSLMRRWPSQAVVSYHSKGWMFFQFPSLQGLRATLEKGPFSIFGIPLHLEPIDDNFSFSKEIAAHLPVWIRIPDLPPLLWTKKVIEKIASTVGLPIQVDEATIKKEILDGPRVKVEINAAVKPRDTIDIKLENGHMHSQKILYESHPKFCLKCRIFGHFGADCLGPAARGRKFTKLPGGFKNIHPRKASRVPQEDGKILGDRLNSRPPSRPPQEKKWQPRHLHDGQPASRPGSPNRFDPLRDQSDDAVEKEKTNDAVEKDQTKEAGEKDQTASKKDPGQEPGQETIPRFAVQDTGSSSFHTDSSSFHTSQTAMVFVGETPSSPPSVHLEEMQLNNDNVVDNWETHMIPTTPFKEKGNSDTTSPSLSSNGNDFVSERVKETTEVEVEDCSESVEEIQATPPPSPQLEVQGGKKKKDKVKDVADQALQKIKHATIERNQKHGHQPSNKKKNRKGGSGSKKRR